MLLTATVKAGGHSYEPAGQKWESAKGLTGKDNTQGQSNRGKKWQIISTGVKGQEKRELGG